ncbi:MAG: hypothetical protein ABSG55_07395 [Dehalococcoidia bacterium]|jgi:hypothetical protein
MRNIFLVALVVLVGLLWSGAIHAEMKWTATMFGLALFSLMANEGIYARPHRRR